MSETSGAALEFVRSDPVDIPAVAGFLAEVFETRGDAPFIDASLMEWKYFDPRPDWEGGRSYTLRRGASLAAHAAVAPIAFLLGDKEVTSGNPIDWAARRTVRMAGVRLLLKLSGLTDTLVTVGGSEVTRQILPGIGYRQLAEVEIYARVVRPWRQFRLDPASRGWKRPLRLARNAAWSLAPLSAAAGRWTCEPVERFEAGAVDGVAGERGKAFTATLRSAGILNHFLRCPGVRFRGFLLREGGATRGWLLSSMANGQTRIADVRISSESPRDWQAAVRVAVQWAMRDPETIEIKAAASTDLARAALLANGFRLRARLPVFLYDPRKLLAGAPPLSLNLIDWDAGYWHDPSYPFVT